MAKLGGDVPERLGLMNLATLEGFKVQYNPERVKERVGAEWRAVAVPGFSHDKLYFSNTKSHELAWALKFLADNTADLTAITDLKRFLLSLVYPVEDGTSPPDVLFIWPGTVRMVVVIKMIDIDNEAFNRAGQMTEFTAQIEAIERRTYQLTSADVRRLGSEREDA
jgi:hypothetical protein